MVKVAGIWELGWNTPLAESYMWAFVLREFEIRDWAMTPVSGIRHTEAARILSLTEYAKMQDILDSDTETQRVYVDEKGETDLREFEHPDDAYYIFGNTGESPMSQFKRDEDLSVRIPTVQNTGVVWPHQCLLTVMYDRMAKGWR